MTFDYTFGLDLPVLKKDDFNRTICSIWRIDGFAIWLALSEQKMAEIVGKSHHEYLLLESARTSIPIEEYEDALQKVKEYQKKWNN